MEEKNSSILYHYCSTDTFYKIISNKALWLSDITKSNDSQELKWVFTRFKQSFSLSYKQKYFKTDEQETYRKVLEFADSFCQKSYICCFSAETEKDSLSQWRGYAADGTGLSFGMDSKQFLNVFPLELLKVEYNASAQDEFITKKVKDLLYGEMTDQHIFNVLLDLFSKAIVYKHPSFCSENEYRLVYRTGLNMSNISFNFALQSEAQRDVEMASYVNIPKTSLDDNINVSLDQGFDNSHFTLSPLTVIIRNNNLVSHFNLGFDSIKDTIFKEIIIGPKSRLNRDDILLFLHSCGYSLDKMRDNGFKISRSNSTYI